jgi:YD repeat-containing protein
VADPVGTITTTVDLLGRVVSYTDAGGATTTSTYDQAGHLTETSEPAGAQRYGFEPARRPTTQSLDGADADPAAPNFIHDAAGRLRAARVPGRALAYDYAATPGCG